MIHANGLLGASVTIPCKQERNNAVLGDTLMSAWAVSYGGWFNPIQRSNAIAFLKAYIERFELIFSKVNHAFLNLKDAYA